MDGLEPIINQPTMKTHHGKHHAAYTKIYNEFAEWAGVADEVSKAAIGKFVSVARSCLLIGLKAFLLLYLLTRTIL